MWTPRTPQTYLERWDLRVDGHAVTTPSSTIVPVLSEGRRAMLKVARIEEEGRGCRLLAWWNGRGAARVFEADDHAAVMERAAGGSLRQVSRGDDEAATLTLCDIAQTLHGASAIMAPPGGLTPLREWFGALYARAESHPDEKRGFWTQAAEIADRLLADDGQEVVLHGDLHHDNVLNFGEGRWKAIDPKNVVGHRLFDYTSLLFNPTAHSAETHFARRIATICHATSASPSAVLEWTLTSAALSAAWFAGEERTAESARLLRIARLAARGLETA
ncbi:phosphotransferase [Salinibacterium sp. SYSU T00001]|uniref:aminoglycoside phosphotransferase family protein n=1 Tax=Homoserinimonas sedimenticola TaxID=2986805 RepID=UPI0022355AD2|nr:aminoglycoside phosphotransferase family protein [Salinibacterium sedimenticola]MCW4384623.1 phosphotransferase [Salinibacterium sedimenticola]